MNKKKSTQIGLVIIFGILVAFLLVESLIRVHELLGNNHLFNLNPPRTNLNWQEDQDIGKVFIQPNSTGWFVTPSKEYYTWIEVNSIGVHDTEHKIEKDPSVFRILLLGDSFVANLQTPIKDSYSKQLENSLNNSYPDKRFEIITIGLGDTGTAQQLLALKKYGLQYKPDLVVQMFLTANDVTNNSQTLQMDSRRPYFKVDTEGELELVPYSKEDNSIKTLTKRFLKKFRIVEGYLFIKQTLSQRNQNKKVDYPTDYHIYDREYNQDFTNAWDITKRLISETKYQVEQNGGRYMLISLANNEQVNNDVLSGIEKQYPDFNNQRIDLEKPDQTLKSFCNDKEIECAFMYPYFKDFENQNSNIATHFKYDGHWNNEGENLAAKFLIDNLKKLIETQEHEEITQN